MFAILKRDWLRSAPLRWAGLFAFEFAVVLLGVLAAQSLQERFAARQDRASFTQTRSALDEQVQTVGSAMIMKGLQARCVRSNLETIVAAMEAEEPLPEETFTTHPPKGAIDLSIWNGDLAARARTYAEPEAVYAYEFMAAVSDGLVASAQNEEAWWATLGMADAANLPQDRRTHVLLAARNLLHAYEGWERAPAALDAMMTQLGVDPQWEWIGRMHGAEVPCAREVRSGISALGKEAKTD